MSDEKPPIGNSWKALYVAVITALAALIVVFYFFGKHFG